MPPLSPKIKIFGDPNAHFAVQRYAFLSTYANLNTKLFIFQNYGTFNRMKVKGEKGKVKGERRKEQKKGVPIDLTHPQVI
jgi:hypothetical protein